jgi:hypothetical protein
MPNSANVGQPVTSKVMITSHVLMNYADPNIPYDIKLDASNYQLGAVVKPAGCAIAFFS